MVKFKHWKHLEVCCNNVVHLWGFFLTQGYSAKYWHSANDRESEGFLYIMHICTVHCAFWSHLDQGFGGRQTEHCCPGLHGGSHKKTIKGPQMEERLRTVLIIISMRALTLVNGVISPALVRITMFVK